MQTPTVQPPEAKRARSLIYGIAWLLGAHLLGACGEKVPASPSLFPLNTGWKWRYEMITITDRGTVKEDYSVENLGKKDHGENLVGWERRNSLGNTYLFKVDESGVYRAGVKNEIEPNMRPDTAKLTRFVLKQPIAKATSWEVDTVPYLLRRSFDWPYELKHTKSISIRYEISETDATIKVPVGEFTNCTVISGSHLMRIYIDPMQGFGDIPIIQKEWYCPGVGLVKLLRQEIVKSTYYFGGSQSFELVEFSKG